jgi:hypothetical protein
MLPNRVVVLLRRRPEGGEEGNAFLIQQIRFHSRPDMCLTQHLAIH